MTRFHGCSKQCVIFLVSGVEDLRRLAITCISNDQALNLWGTPPPKLFLLSFIFSVQIDKHVKLLSEVVPEWLSIMYVRKCPYVKLKKNVNIKVLTEKLKSSEVN